MNFQQSRIIYLSIIATSLMIIGYTLYHFYEQMGGFKEINVMTMGPVKRKVAGIHFIGKVNSNAYKEIREICDEQLMTGKLDGYFTEITFQNDSISPKEIDQFIGITLNTSMAEIPYEFEVREFVSNQRFVLPMGIHPMVRKPAEKYEEMILKQAKEEGMKLRPFFMAIHFGTDSMAVEGWVTP